MKSYTNPAYEVRPIFYSTGYTAAYPYDSQRLRSLADHLAAALVTAGAVVPHGAESTARIGG